MSRGVGCVSRSASDDDAHVLEVARGIRAILVALSTSPMYQSAVSWLAAAAEDPKLLRGCAR